jgi:hypothetical protein
MDEIVGGRFIASEHSPVLQRRGRYYIPDADLSTS